MLVVHPPNRALVVYRSRDVLLRDLRIDYRPVPYVQGTITKIDNERSTLEFEPHPGHVHPIEGNDSLYKNGRNEESVTFNHENRKFYHAHSRVSGIVVMGNGRFRVSYRGHRFSEASVGDYFAMKSHWGVAHRTEKHRYAGPRAQERVHHHGRPKYCDCSFERCGFGEYPLLRVPWVDRECARLLRPRDTRSGDSATRRSTRGWLKRWYSRQMQ